MKKHIRIYKNYNGFIYLKSLSEVFLYLMSSLSDCLIYLIL